MNFTLARSAAPVAQLRSSVSAKLNKSAMKPRMVQRRNMVVRADLEAEAKLVDVGGACLRIDAVLQKL